jgi:hypothetical protein
MLEAIALADGKRLWDRPVGATEGGWRVRFTKNALLVHPSRALPVIDSAALARRCLPLGLSAAVPAGIGTAAAGAAVVSRREQAPSRFAVLVCDPKDGQLIQRLNFAGHGTNADVLLTPRGLVVNVGGAVFGLQ